MGCRRYVFIFDIYHKTYDMAEQRKVILKNDADIEDALCTLVTYAMFKFDQDGLYTTIDHLMQITSKASICQLVYFASLFHTKLVEIKAYVGDDIPLMKYIGIGTYVARVLAVFEDFMKGITYFAHDARIPIYHRFYVFGGSTYMSGCLVGDMKLKTHQYALLERCYIERLVFMELYNTHMGHKEHMPMFCIKKTHDDFRKCCPDTHIDIAVEYDRTRNPNKLTVRKTQTTSDVETILQFEKRVIVTEQMTYYAPVVYVTKYEHGKIYIKSCTFEIPSRFIV